MTDVLQDMRRHPLQRKTPPWQATVVAQAFLCVGLYLAFRVGAPPGVLRRDRAFESSHELSRGFDDIHFLSVSGGWRPINQQMQLLQLMNTAARIYKVEFVVCLTEYGDNDALLLNATLNFEALRIPWLTTDVSHSQDKDYFLKQFKISGGKMLDVIVLDSSFWKVDSEATGGNPQHNWLTRALISSNGTWHVAIGLHPLTNCDDDQTASGSGGIYSHISGHFLKHGVDLYISKQRCSTSSGYTFSVPYIENPSYVDENFQISSRKPNKETERMLVDGFHLHRVSPLEIETYFVNLAGDVTSSRTVHHFEKQTM